MPIEISTDGASVTNAVSLDGAPAVLISGDDVIFENLPTGVLTATSATEPVIRVTGLNSHIITQLGARIEAQFGYYDAIHGGAGSDVVDNYATIYGWTRLGDGTDTFNQYFSSATSGTAAVDLGAGNDRYNLLVGSGPILFSAVHGGAGADTLNLASTLSVVYGFNFLEFEHLILGANVTNLVSFSGLSSVTLTPGGFNNFVTSANPTVDLQLNANWLSVGPGSQFRNISGSSGNDILTLRTNTAYGPSRIAAADLGAGNDTVIIDTFQLAAAAPLVDTFINAGTGSDTLQVLSRSATYIDLTRYLDFENLSIGTQAVGWTETARASNADGYLLIEAGGDVVIADSNSPQAMASVYYLGRMTLEGATTLGSYGWRYYPAGFRDVQIGDTQYNLTVINQATILGAVELYLGDDLYDGSLGTTGGTIFGFAGSDVLKGGASADRIEGGFGDDTIHGGGGANTLLGGAGADRFVLVAADAGSAIDGGAGLDTLAVLAGTVGGLGALTGLERIEIGVGAVLTLSGAQFASGFATNSALAGAGTLIVGMTAGTAFNAAAMMLEGAASLGFTITGSGGADVIKANVNAVNTIIGGAGNDQIRGGLLGDTIQGGADADKIVGYGGADMLSGGAGADQFRFLFASDSGTGAGADRITDFLSGTDRLNFALLDADPVAAGRQALSFINTAAFTATGAAQVRYTASGADLLVQADLDGNGTADMEIVLLGASAQTLTSSDFML